MIIMVAMSPDSEVKDSLTNSFDLKFVVCFLRETEG